MTVSASTMRVLAGDLGATKTVLALADVTDTNVTPVVQRRYENDAYSGVSALIEAFRSAAGRAWAPEAAAFGLAGTVSGHHRARMTNRPWELDATELSTAYELGQVLLLNDLEASAHGLAALAPKDLRCLQAGQPDGLGPRALMAAGTGFGHCLMVPEGSRVRMLPSEAGHADFTPADDAQVALLQQARQQAAPVGVEYFLSGPGISRLYAFTSGGAGARTDPEMDAAPESIVERGLAGSDAAASRTLDLFIRIYGGQAGNIALTCLPTGGVFIAGAIAVHLAEALDDGRFLEAFRRKDKMTSLLARLPIHLVLRTDIPVLGAALVAADPVRAGA